MTFRQMVKYWFYGQCPGVAGQFPYYGMRVYFPPGAAIFKVICQQGVFESEIIHLLTTLARPDTWVFDVGANIGLMSVPVLQSCSTCRVVSFEPSPNSLPYLQRSSAESLYSDRWKVIGKAVSREAGKLDFTVGRPRDALFEGFKSGARIPDARTVTVPVTTLDEEWRQLGLPIVSVVKIDVEGAEGLVLEGSRTLIETCRPHLIIEWHEPYLRAFGTSSDQLLSLADQIGYRIYTVPSGIPIDDKRTLQVQLMTGSNFLLMP
jgi:FkbM family methyltransferase